MFKAIRRIWKYVGTAIGMKFDELADPKVQLTQALEEAQDQHRKLKQQAASVIANQKQTELRLNRVMADLEKTTKSAHQAVLMSDQAQRESDAAKYTEYTRVAESLATRMIALEEEAGSLKELHLQTSQAADQAKSAVQANAAALQKKISERQKLLSQLDQAKMQEQVNKAMNQLTESVGQDVPTFDQVRAKIEERYAKALGAADLQDNSIEMKMIEMEQLALDAEAHARVDAIRTQLGLPIGNAPANVQLTSGDNPSDAGNSDAGGSGAAASGPANSGSAASANDQSAGPAD
jgi:phage shock protein A